jgi:hypothetical protein
VDPDPVGSASFCWIGIGIGVQGMPIRIGTYKFQTKKEVDDMLSTILKTLTLMRKMKHCKLAMAML